MCCILFSINKKSRLSNMTKLIVTLISTKWVVVVVCVCVCEREREREIRYEFYSHELAKFSHLLLRAHVNNGMLHLKNVQITRLKQRIPTSRTSMIHTTLINHIYELPDC